MKVKRIARFMVGTILPRAEVVAESPSWGLREYAAFSVLSKFQALSSMIVKIDKHPANDESNDKPKCAFNMLFNRGVIDPISLLVTEWSTKSTSECGFPSVWP